ncbi:hypothetical protein IV102_24520 [bacterium]|nr:hypothetical protein [bacterium]
MREPGLRASSPRPGPTAIGTRPGLVNTPDWRNALDDYRSLPQRLRGTNVMVEELWLLLALQDFTAAERLLIKIARKNLPEAQRHKPYFLYAQGRYPEAMAAFETASLAQSGKYVGLGWTAWKMGQSEKATEYATLSLAAARTLEPLLLVAQLTLDAGSLDEAEAHIKECLELDPCDITGLHLQGCLAEARYQPDRAREAFLRCVEEGPKRRSWPPEQQRVEDARRRLVNPD